MSDPNVGQSLYSPGSPKDSSYSVAVPIGNTNPQTILRVDSNKSTKKTANEKPPVPLLRPSASDHFLSMIDAVGGTSNGNPHRPTNVNFHFQEQQEENFPPYLEMRAGLHVGPIASGIVGFERPLYDLFGDTVNTAARLESNGQPSTVHILSTTADLLLSTPPPMWLNKAGGGVTLDCSSNGSTRGRKSHHANETDGITMAVPETYNSAASPSAGTPSKRTDKDAKRKISKFASSVVAAENGEKGASSPLSNDGGGGHHPADVAYGIWDPLNNPEHICFDPQGELTISLKGIGEVNTLLVKDYRNRKASVVTMSMSTMN